MPVTYHQINTGKLLERFYKSKLVPDEDKLKLSKKLSAKCVTEWKAQYDAKEAKRVSEVSAGFWLYGQLTRI